MSRRVVPFLFTLACLATTPVIARAQQATTPPSAPAPAPAPLRAAALPGPRVQPEYPRYEPALAGDHKSVTAAADRTVITISTLGLVLLIVLLVILIA